ncbi:hypothetical protein AHF37_12852 [Paragonimus kellicotti]|nr:hypothetical protein AHF37_12852 [Paragonimus kellicotti]
MLLDGCYLASSIIQVRFLYLSNTAHHVSGSGEGLSI